MPATLTNEKCCCAEKIFARLTSGPAKTSASPLSTTHYSLSTPLFTSPAPAIYTRMMKHIRGINATSLSPNRAATGPARVPWVRAVATPWSVSMPHGRAATGRSRAAANTSHFHETKSAKNRLIPWPGRELGHAATSPNFAQNHRNSAQAPAVSCLRSAEMQHDRSEESR